VLRLMLAAICCQKGDWEANLADHDRVLGLARAQGCQLAVFPEMSLSGYVDPAGHPEQLLTLDSPPVMAMAELTGRHSVAAVFGLSERGEDGAAYITQAYAHDGRLAGSYRKRHLGDGEEAYTPGTEKALFRFGGVSFGIAICAEGGVDYPFDEPAAAGAEAVFFCAAPGLYGRRTDERSWRDGLAWWESCGLADARRHAARTGTWVALVTQAGSTVDEDFPGLAALISPDGEVTDRLPDWRPGTLTVDLPLSLIGGSQP
jgi:predicted amidohydrolase